MRGGRVSQRRLTAGRDTPFNYDLTYDSSIWVPVTVGGVKQWQPAGNWGWNSDAAALTGYVTATETTTTIPGPPCNPIARPCPSAQQQAVPVLPLQEPTPDRRQIWQRKQ